MTITREEKREIRKGTTNIGAIVSFLIFVVVSLISGGKVIQRVEDNQMSVKENKVETNKKIDEIREKYEKLAEENRFLQTQVQSINHKLQMKQDKK